MSEAEGVADERLVAAHRALRDRGDVQFDMLAVEPPAPPPEWLKSLGRWLEQMMAPVGRFLRWISSFMPDAPYARIFLWTVIALLLLLVLRVAYDRARHGEQDGDRPPGTTKGRSAHGVLFSYAAWKRLRTPAVWRDVTTRGSSGLGASYIDGWWDTDDLTGLIRFCLRNLEAVDRAQKRLHRATRPIGTPSRVTLDPGSSTRPARAASGSIRATR